MKRAEPILKIVCLFLGILAVYLLAKIIRPQDGLSLLKVPKSDSTITTHLAETNKSTAPQPGSAGMTASLVVPSSVQGRVERITQSEILAPVMRPLPMALLGIGGKDAIIRTPMGQTSLLREGEEAGGVKLLKIGTNRVMIEHEGKQKELMIFSGFGSQSLVNKEIAK
jgi:hypothetical protein